MVFDGFPWRREQLARNQWTGNGRGMDGEWTGNGRRRWLLDVGVVGLQDRPVAAPRGGDSLLHQEAPVAELPGVRQAARQRDAAQTQTHRKCRWICENIPTSSHRGFSMKI